MAGVKRSRLVVVGVTAGAKSALLGVDMHRYLVMFLPSKLGDYVVGDETMAGQGDGFVVSINSSYVEFTADRHGSRVKENWFCFSSAGVTSVPILIVDD